MKISSNLVAFLENMNCTYLSGTWQQKSYHKGLSTLKKYQGKPMVLHDFFHHSAIISCITFHIWKSVDSETFNKVYRGILRFLSVHRNTRFIEGWTVLTETIVLTPQKILFCLLFEVLVFSTVHCSETCSWYQFHYGHFCHSESKLLGKIKYWIGWSFELMQFIYYWPSLKGGGNWSEKIEFPSCQVAKVIIQLDHFWPTVMCQHKWASSTMHIRVDLLKLWSQEWVRKREAEREKKR